MKLFLFLTSLSFLIIGISCTKDVGPNPDLIPKSTEACDTVTFSKHIKPLITNYCATTGCHLPGSQSPDLSDNNIIQSQADRIKARLIDQNDMPPSGSPVPTGDEVNSIKCWLNAGAPLN